MFVYRISSKHFPPFDGGGAFLHGSRWLDKGRMVIHAADCWSLALLENMVHWNTVQIPTSLVQVRARLPDGAVIERTPTGFDVSDKRKCRAHGNSWFDQGESLAMIVPSIISAYENNLLINQMHPNFRDIELIEQTVARIDSRLLRGEK